MNTVNQTIDDVRAAGLGKWCFLRCRCQAGFEVAKTVQLNAPAISEVLRPANDDGLD
jgi:hypothetical protein